MEPEAQARASPAGTSPRGRRPFAAIALGFLALALPLFVAVALSENATGAWTNAAAGAVFVLLGALLWTRRG